MERIPFKPPLRDLPWVVDYDDGVLPIALHEGYFEKAYLCPAGKWTNGYGETDGVGPNTVWDHAFASQRLCDSIAERVTAVLAACTVEPTSNQLCALVSFAYNYGGWRKSSALKAHNRGDVVGCAAGMRLVNQFTNPATGKKEVARGLVIRRAAEAALYLRPSSAPERLPQAVEPEKSMAKSPTIQLGATGAAIGAIETITSIGKDAGTVNEAISPVKSALASGKALLVEWVGAPPDWLFPALVTVICVIVLYRRFSQRRRGVD